DGRRGAWGRRHIGLVAIAPCVDFTADAAIIVHGAGRQAVGRTGRLRVGLELNHGVGGGHPPAGARLGVTRYATIVGRGAGLEAVVDARLFRRRGGVGRGRRCRNRRGDRDGRGRRRLGGGRGITARGR